MNISIFQEEGGLCVAGTATPSEKRVKRESGWDLLPTLPGPGDTHTTSVRMQGKDQDKANG